ncbi:helix-turn-helix domain-containing protein [Endozoicomonas sp. SESOKO1]|uniref:helix-turn-helix domain-containing protein n=1 Tax=Endozoicomonas sp. SESOKO1 TaxID=2828742 RepID=UPI00214991FB
MSSVNFSYLEGAMTEIRLNNLKELSAYERWLYVVMSALVYNDEGQHFYSHKLIADISGLSVSSVRKYLRSLETKGFLKIDVRYNEKGDHSSNLYTIIGKPVVRPKKAERYSSVKVGLTLEEKIHDRSWDTGLEF